MLIRVAIKLVLLPLLLTAGIANSAENLQALQVTRLGNEAIIKPEMDDRMAYVDELDGPWTVYTPGAPKLEDSYFPATCPPCALAVGASGTLYAHIASPDVHVREDLKQIVMYAMMLVDN